MPRASLAAVSAALFALLTVAAGAGLTERLDLRVTRAVQVRPAAWLDWLGSLLGLAGSLEVTTGLLLGLAVALWWRGAAPLALALLIAFALAIVIEVMLKRWLPHPAPPPEFSRPTWGHVPSGDVPPGDSYPSGHAMRSTFLLLAGWWLTSRRALGVAAAVVLALMVASRVYVGAHWASDVAGGMLLGLIACAAAPWLSHVAIRSRTIAAVRAPRRGWHHGE